MQQTRAAAHWTCAAALAFFAPFDQIRSPVLSACRSQPPTPIRELAIAPLPIFMPPKFHIKKIYVIIFSQKAILSEIIFALSECKGHIAQLPTRRAAASAEQHFLHRKPARKKPTE
ncbi:hypothetical protein [Desulfovibrio sp. Fe33]|uniref:hypothetical protein n=1 Tax=Desulfovibrio sp. Fe33 TaxID=3020842 RepID=UPI00234DE6C0|nr:hypothetical protein [Desulfovibrio sp. Fe33]